MPVAEKVLILGGTLEAAALAQELVSSGADVTTSLAGRTKEPSPIAGAVRIGGFGGAEALADWLRKNHIQRVIDATHPFALQISKNAARACKIAGVELEIKSRKPWLRQDADNWIETHDLVEAANAIPDNARVLLALGSQYLSAFSHRTNVHFVVRMVDQPEQDLPLCDHTLVLGKPYPRWQDERDLLQHHKITHIVYRNSGGDGAYAKIVAARELAISVIIINMPR